MRTGYEIFGPQPWRRPVDSTRNDPPVAPVLGESHIIGDTPAGAWVGRSGQIARWNGTAWKYETPVAGWRTYIKGMATHQVFDTSWSNVDYGSVGGTPTGQLDGGSPESEFGGTEPVDGGEV